MRPLTLLAVTAFALASLPALAQDNQMKQPEPEEAGVLEPAVTAADANQDGSVDYYEYDAWLNQHADTEKPDWTDVYNAGMSAFGKADADRDGKLDAGEAQAFLGSPVAGCTSDVCPGQGNDGVPGAQ